MNIFRIWFVRFLGYLFITLLVGCNLPNNKPTQSTPLLPTFVQLTPAEQPILTSMPIGQPTDTLIPPDFDQIVNFGGGGGGGECENAYSGYQPSFYIGPHGNVMTICIWGASPPFSLEFLPPDGKLVRPINIVVDQTTSNIQWEGYDAGGYLSSEGTLIEIDAWIPINFSPGSWQFRATGGFQAEGNFLMEKEGDPPYIAAINPSFGREFAPGDLEHLLKLKENGRVDVIGTSFPANTLTYVLLYHYETSASQYSLINTQTAYTDVSGSISTELIGPFNIGQSYLVVTVTDPYTHITIDGNEFDTSLSHDFFQVVVP